MPNDLSLIRAVFGANKPGSGSWHAIIRDAGPAFRFTQCGLWLLLSPMSFRGARKREPGIHNPCCGVRIPDRRFASSGMTASSRVYTADPSFAQTAFNDFDYSPTAFYLLVTKLTEGRLPETDQRRSMVRPCGRDL